MWIRAVVRVILAGVGVIIYLCQSLLTRRADTRALREYAGDGVVALTSLHSAEQRTLRGILLEYPDKTESERQERMGAYRYAADKVGDAFQSTAYAARLGALPLDSILDNWGLDILHCWSASSDRVAEHRKDAPAKWSDYEWLANEALKRQTMNR